MKDVLEQLLERCDLSEQQAEALLIQLTETSDSPALVGAVLSALRLKGESADELRGFARAMRKLARRPAIEPGLAAVDIVGTGGDGSNSLNLSTGAALLVAACGLPVIKHGNRAVSSQSGSADVLEALGMRLPADGAEAGRLFAETGFTFLFAPHFHPAMKNLAAIRRDLGVRTVFNLLGPLTNPAAPPFALVGACNLPAAKLIADAFAGLPIRRVFVVHGAQGWDEPTPVGPFHLFDVQGGVASKRIVEPLDFGLSRCSAEDLAGGTSIENAHRLTQVLCGQGGPARDAVMLSAALALEAAGVVSNTMSGLKRCVETLDSGAAADLVTRIVKVSTTEMPAGDRSYG